MDYNSYRVLSKMARGRRDDDDYGTCSIVFPTFLLDCSTGVALVKTAFPFVKTVILSELSDRKLAAIQSFEEPWSIIKLCRPPSTSCCLFRRRLLLTSFSENLFL